MPGARGDKRSHLHPVKAKVGQKFAGGQTYPVAALVRGRSRSAFQSSRVSSPQGARRERRLL